MDFDSLRCGGVHVKAKHMWSPYNGTPCGKLCLGLPVTLIPCSSSYILRTPRWLELCTVDVIALAVSLGLLKYNWRGEGGGSQFAYLVVIIGHPERLPLGGPGQV